MSQAKHKCWDHGDGVLARLRASKSHELPTTKQWISKNTATTGYQHMAMLSALPPTAYPWRWMAIWQASDRYEGSQDMHFECALSSDGDTWSRDCAVPLNRGPSAKWLVRIGVRVRLRLGVALG